MVQRNEGLKVPDSIPEPANNLPPKDWGFRGLMALAVLIAAWLLAMPWVPAISQSTMRRFHLQSTHFGWWAVQQAIPPMYSFRNTTEIRSTPPGLHSDKIVASELMDPILSDLNLVSDVSASTPDPGWISARTINHFPSREFTFGNGRYRYLRGHEPRYFILESQYRGQQLRSVYRLARDDNGVWKVTLRSPTGW
ncbi:MAG: hypothetical protein AAF670_17880 [Planctomycetota bacterium]